ncbi:NAD(P)H-flavin reductase [Legionella dresdenensis]|uniref:NAD(P)H-flavin reductase n=1 Tax=Legionella dresdenensis TaxID=450200 RepID=A0ABV8CDT6_9GAMM
MPLTDSILRLHLIPEQYIDYEPGQYLQITSAGERLSYSIANAPLGSHKYELHIRHKGNPYQQPLFKEIRESGSVTISLPYGDCHLNRLDTGLPIIFIAGGTGFAPIKAMIEQLLATGDKRQFELYWGARSQSDLYLDEQVQKWQTHVSNFSYFSQHSDRNQKDALAKSVLKQHGHDLANYQIVFAGPFDMVYSVRDKLLDHGIERSRLYSDAFSFEARS